MSRPKNAAPRPTLAGPEGATPKGIMKLTGVVRTTKGYAVAVATLDADGEVCGISLRHSQTHKEFIALEHKRVMTEAVQSA